MPIAFSKAFSHNTEQLKVSILGVQMFQQSSTKLIINPSFISILQFFSPCCVIFLCIRKCDQNEFRYAVYICCISFHTVEAQLMACSAVIKEIKIQTSFSKTHSAGLSTKINKQSLQTHPKIGFTNLHSIWLSFLGWYGEMLRMNSGVQ